MLKAPEAVADNAGHPALLWFVPKSVRPCYRRVEMLQSTPNRTCASRSRFYAVIIPSAAGHYASAKRKQLTGLLGLLSAHS